MAERRTLDIGLGEKVVIAARVEFDKTVALAEDLLRVVVNNLGGFPGKSGDAARECARQAAILHAECARIAERGIGGTEQAGDADAQNPDAGDSDADPDAAHATYRPDDPDTELWGLE